MESVIYRFTLDCKKAGSQKTLQGFSTGDGISRKLAITLMYGSQTFEFDPNTCEALMYVKNPLSNVISIEPCTFQENTVMYTVSKTDVKDAGDVICQLKLIFTSPETGVRRVLVAPRFTIEVDYSDNIDEIIEEELAKGTFEGTFTALEKAVARAQAYYHTRLIQIEIDNQHIFHAYFADGTEYVNDELKDAYDTCVTSEQNAKIYSDKSESYAVGGTETREGEDTDNAKYYKALAESAFIAADEARVMAEQAAQEAIKESAYATFTINFETGNVEYESNNYVWNIDMETGNLTYEHIE